MGWVVRLGLLGGFWTFSVFAHSWARTSTACPHEKLETCRWEIHARNTGTEAAPVVQIDWEKSVVSRHTEKPLAKALICNVDRDFNAAKGGYIRVWFEGEAAPCDPTVTNPADCGVRFLLLDPRDFHSAQGFVVTPPRGKTLKRVEHLSTLHLQCGDFSKPDPARLDWDVQIGWLAGQGTYKR